MEHRVLPDLDLLDQGWVVEKHQGYTFDGPHYLYSKGHYVYLREWEAHEVEAASAARKDGHKR